MRTDTTEVGAPFGPPRRFETRFEQVTDRAGILDLVASRSYVIVLSEEERRALRRGQRRRVRIA